MSHKHTHAVLGGTFDHLHAGHERILHAVFDAASHVTIGVTSDTFVKEKELSNIIQPHDVRMKALENYILSNNWDDRVFYEILDDIYGTAGSRGDIDSIMITSDSEPNAQIINDKRAQLNLPKLAYIRVPLLRDAKNEVISSTRIRKGQIDRTGSIYLDEFSENRSLPQPLRKTLQMPLGEVMQTKEVLTYLANKEPTLIITVGDIVTQSLRDNDTKAHIEIIDYRTRREAIGEKIKRHHFDAKNPAGTITYEAVKVIEHAFIAIEDPANSICISIDGEEDLLALPAIQLAPLGSVVLYGIFDKGVVVVLVDEEMKKRVAEIMSSFH
ncbi:MAG: pantetheine-phosphate adenylyltransferase [bacterium]|nr:pantetheine-phosphate adenylyltransferase [bacterium]